MLIFYETKLKTVNQILVTFVNKYEFLYIKEYGMY